MSHGHVVKVNSVLQTESGTVVEGEKVPHKILAKNEKMKKMMETMKKMMECKEVEVEVEVECNWSANLAKKMPPISKMCLVDGQGGTVLSFVNNENLVVASGLVDKSMVDVGCLELLEKSQEKMRRRLEEEEDAKRKEEDAKRCQRKARNEENELRRREEEHKLMEARVKARSAGSLAIKFKQGKDAFFAKDWGR